MSFWRNRRVMVTGGAGFLGSFLVERLQQRGCPMVIVPRRVDYDLRDKIAIRRLLHETQPDIVIHLASSSGGIGANLENPAPFFYDNAVMGIELIEQSRQYGVEKFVAIGTVCSYPKFTPVPFREAALWDGYPEETNAAYGLAKKMLLVQAQAYRAQYGVDAIYLIPVNLYGPRDHFDPRRSHVIPAMIAKCEQARKEGKEEIVLWGTGKPTREFLYVEDCAEGILLATERYHSPEPVNLGSGVEISIQDLASLIMHLTGFSGAVIWDSSRPDGQPRRLLDTSRALNAFGFRATTSLEGGLVRTIEWYRKGTA
jgi:GDP-L-fucose synthase